MTKKSHTNTALATYRRCLREGELRYGLRLEPVGQDREVLRVGQTWHVAHDVEYKGGNPYEAILLHAPGAAWNEKLRRLYACYGWYWQQQPLNLIASERTFRIEFGGHVYEGQVDGRLQDSLGRTGVLERKTCGEDIGAGSPYWQRLRMDVQTGLYALAEPVRPSFIVYDVVRKPTIRAKALPAAEVVRMRTELEDVGVAVYYGERFTPDMARGALEEKRESLLMYGARLTSDIGDQPEKYFARREVTRTDQDFDTLIKNLGSEATLIELAEELGLLFRNPDACRTFGICDFFRLCENNIHPKPGDPVPDGFQVRPHLHPELVREDSTT